MIELFLAYALSLGPFIAAAILVGFIVPFVFPWIWNHPDRWLFFLIFGLGLTTFGSATVGSEGSLVKQLPWGSLFVFCALKLFFDKQITSSWGLQAIAPPLLLLVVFALVSLSWSPVPAVSMKRLAQIVGILLIGLLVARQMAEGRGLLTQITWPAAFFLCVGLVFAIGMPSAGFDEDRALRAFTSHKNTWGQFSLIAALAFSLAFVIQRQYRWIYLVLLGIAIVSLFASRSSTSILAFVLLAGILLIWLALNRWGVLGKVFVIVAVCIIALVIHAYVVITANSPIEYLTEQIFSATGKSSTLSGRVYLWNLLFSEIARHPWLGIGYGGFWTGIEGASGMVIRQLNWGPPTQSHSGYIDVVNELGFVGLTLLTLLLIAQLRNLIRLYRVGQREISLFHSAILFCAIVINYAETSFLRTTHLWWILLCVSIIEVNVRLANDTLQLPSGYPQRGKKWPATLSH